MKKGIAMMLTWMKNGMAKAALRFALALAVTLGCACALPACSADQAAEDAPAQSQAAMSVEVSVTTAEGESAYSGSVQLPEGATALDALEATGLDYVVEDSQYGMFVSSINGLANGETSATAGWMYSLNGEMALESCDALVLSNGDLLTWEYAEFE